MWAFPYLTVVTIVGIAGILLAMAILPGRRLELWLSIGLAAVLVIAGAVVQRRGSRSVTAPSAPVGS
jgi:GABA permease